MGRKKKNNNKKRQANVGLDAGLVLRASSALLRHVQLEKAKEKQNLLETNAVISMIIGLHKVPENGKVKPRRM